MAGINFNNYTAIAFQNQDRIHKKSTTGAQGLLHTSL
jgi:hypothetical protein